MAVNTADKRAASVNMSLPIADGSIAKNDRFHITWGFDPTTVAEAPANPGANTLTGYDRQSFSTHVEIHDNNRVDLLRCVYEYDRSTGKHYLVDLSSATDLRLDIFATLTDDETPVLSMTKGDGELFFSTDGMDGKYIASFTTTQWADLGTGRYYAQLSITDGGVLYKLAPFILDIRVS